MSFTGNILERAASRLGSSSAASAAAAATDHMQVTSDAPELKLTTPLLGEFERMGILTVEFRLAPQEEDLILKMVRDHKLVNSLTLFDLFFFDLHRQIACFENFLSNDDYVKIFAELELFYAVCIEKGHDSASNGLNTFLGGLVERVIRSNFNKVRSMSLKPEDSKVKAAADTQLILKTLPQRVSLFAKFLTSPAAQPLLFSSQLRQLKGCEKINEEDLRTFQIVFKNNALFIQLAFSSLCQLFPEFKSHEKILLTYAAAVEEMGPSIEEGSLQKSLTDNFNLQALTNNSKIMGIIFHKSILDCQALAGDIKLIVTSHKSRLAELAHLSGHRRTMVDKPHLDPRDPLAAFKERKLISQNFYLSSCEENLLQELFKECPADPHLALIDLLTFALDQRLEKLQLIVPQRLHESLTLLRCKLSAYSFLLRLGLYRLSDIDTYGAVNKYSRKFAFFPDIFSGEMNRELRSFEGIIRQADEELSHKQISKKSKEATLKNRDKILWEMQRTITPLVDLWSRLAQVSGGDNLMFKSLLLYRGGNEIRNNRSRESARTLRAYYHAQSIGYRYCLDKGFIGVRHDLTELERIFFSSSKPTEKEMATFGLAVASHNLDSYRLIQSGRQDLLLSLKGELTHTIWLEKKGEPLVRLKTDLEFLEMIYSNSTVVHILSQLYSDMLRLTELELFPRGTVTTEACFFRLCYNFSRLEESDSHLISKRAFMHKGLLNILRSLEDVIRSRPFIALVDSMRQNEHIRAGFFTQGYWIECMTPLNDDEGFKLSRLLISSLESLKLLPEQILKELGRQWQELSLKDLEAIDPSAIREGFFHEGLQLLRPILILFDVLTILGKRPYPTKPSVVPQELADVMDLDGIEGLLRELIQAKRSKSAEEIPTAAAAASSLATVAALKNEKASSPPEVAEKTAVTAIKKPPLPKSVAAATVAVSNAGFDPHEFVNLKQRKLLNRLEEMGFLKVRGGKGSHEKYILPGLGGAVTVPRDPAKGTLYAIGRQVSEMLSRAVPSDEADS